MISSPWYYKIKWGSIQILIKSWYYDIQSISLQGTGMWDYSNPNKKMILWVSKSLLKDDIMISSQFQNKVQVWVFIQILIKSWYYDI